MSLSAKKEALNTIKNLPEGAGWDEIMYELYVRQKIERGIKAADQGKVLSHQEVKKRFLK